MNSTELMAQMGEMADQAIATVAAMRAEPAVQADALRSLRDAAYHQMMAFPDAALGVAFHQKVYMAYAAAYIGLTSRHGLTYETGPGLSSATSHNALSPNDPGAFDSADERIAVTGCC